MAETSVGRPAVATAGPAAPAEATAGPRRPRFGRDALVTVGFLLPALLLLGAVVVYPIVFTVVRSLYDANGDTFVGLANYQEMFTSPRTLQALQNNVIWVVFAPSIVTALGLIFAVLSERVRWSTAFKVTVFMPMAISFLASGVIFRLVFEDTPERGLANAAVSLVSDVFREPGRYPGAQPSGDALTATPDGGFATEATFQPGDTAALGLVRIPAALVPDDAQEAVAAPPTAADAITGTVWLDFTRGGGGQAGAVDPSEQGLPGVTVEAVGPDGTVAASATSGADGAFAVEGMSGGPYALRLTPGAFREPFGGVTWLGPALVTPAIITAFVWMWAGFAMVVIGAGLASIPREVLEAARVDGASEWQVFRRITVPLLAPVLLVVLVTLMINVLKIFDLVLVLAPGSVQDTANVVALEMYRVSFGGARDQGLGSALAILLFLLVLPAMAFNIKRFLAEQ